MIKMYFYKPVHSQNYSIRFSNEMTEINNRCLQMLNRIVAVFIEDRILNYNLACFEFDSGSTEQLSEQEVQLS
jgi:hypothetical protein